MNLREGETFVEGSTRENARALLAAAESLDVDVQQVRAVEGGFIVPDAVADEADFDTDEEHEDG